MLNKVPEVAQSSSSLELSAYSLTEFCVSQAYQSIHFEGLHYRLINHWSQIHYKRYPWSTSKTGNVLTNIPLKGVKTFSGHYRNWQTVLEKLNAFTITVAAGIPGAFIVGFLTACSLSTWCSTHDVQSVTVVNVIANISSNLWPLWLSAIHGLWFCGVTHV